MFPKCNETIIVHIGQAGSNIGLKMWEILINELNYYQNNQNNNILIQNNYHPVTFEIVNTFQYKPRAIFIDYENSISQNLSQNYKKYNFDQTNFAFPYKDLFNQFNSIDKNETYLDIMNSSLRNQMERCHSLSGLIIMGSAGGFAGCNLGLKFHEILEDFQSKLCKINIPLYSMKEENLSELQIFNQINTTLWLQKYSDLIFPFDLFCIKEKLEKYNLIPIQGYDEINKTIAKLITLLFSSLRFENNNSANLWQLIDFLRFEESRKFIITNMEPINSNIVKLMAEKDLIYNCFKGMNLINCDLRNHISLKDYVVIEALNPEFSINKLKELVELIHKNFIKKGSISNWFSYKNYPFSNPSTSDHNLSLLYCSNSSSISYFFGSLIRQNKKYNTNKNLKQLGFQNENMYQLSSDKEINNVQLSNLISVYNSFRG